MVACLPSSIPSGKHIASGMCPKPTGFGLQPGRRVRINALPTCGTPVVVVSAKMCPPRPSTLRQRADSSRQVCLWPRPVVRPRRLRTMASSWFCRLCRFCGWPVAASAWKGRSYVQNWSAFPAYHREGRDSSLSSRLRSLIGGTPRCWATTGHVYTFYAEFASHLPTRHEETGDNRNKPMADFRPFSRYTR